MNKAKQNSTDPKIGLADEMTNYQDILIYTQATNIYICDNESEMHIDRKILNLVY